MRYQSFVKAFTNMVANKCPDMTAINQDAAMVETPTALHNFVRVEEAASANKAVGRVHVGIDALRLLKDLAKAKITGAMISLRMT